MSAAVWLDLSWRWLMILLGLASVVYAFLILRTHFPEPVNGHQAAEIGAGRAIWRNIRIVLANRPTRIWLLYLFIFAVLEAPLAFTPVWLNEQVGLNQAQVGLYRALEMAVSIVSLIVLDCWLAKRSYRRVLRVASLVLLALFPIWLLASGVWSRFLLAIPIAFLLTVYWPIGKSQSLASAPGLGGTVTAVTLGTEEDEEVLRRCLAMGAD